MRLFQVRIYSAWGNLTTAVYNKHSNLQSINEAISKEMNANCKLLWGNGKLKEGKFKPLNTWLFSLLSTFEDNLAYPLKNECLSKSLCKMFSCFKHVYQMVELTADLYLQSTVNSYTKDFSICRLSFIQGPQKMFQEKIRGGVEFIPP